jgi:hypothetical protein
VIGEQELLTRFTYHPPRDDAQPVMYEQIRTHAHDFAACIDAVVPDSREKGLAITAIEEAVMWANAGIARRDRPER